MVTASDLKNGEDMVEMVRNSLSTNSHFGKLGFEQKPKPVCLIIDELDGAFGGGAYQADGISKVAAFIQKCLKM